MGLVPEPPAPPIGSLMNRDAIDPRFQAGVGIEILDAAKDLDEDFLGSIRSIGGIVEDTVNQTVNWLVIVRDEPRERLFRPGLQFGHDGGFFGADSYRTCEFTQGC